MAENNTCPATERLQDNVAQYYKDRYGLACELLKTKNRGAALDVAFSTLEQPGVGIYRRAVVNLFISINADFFSLNQAEYAVECLNLLKRLRKTTTATTIVPKDDNTSLEILSSDAEEAIKCIEEQTVTRLHEIHAMALRVQTDERALEEVSVQTDEPAEDSEDQDDDDKAGSKENIGMASQGNDDQDADMQDERGVGVGVQPFQIMGMFIRKENDSDAEMLDEAKEDDMIGKLPQ